jgi:RNA-directed DNA polymerase
MPLGEAAHQKPGRPGRTGDGRGEAASQAVGDEAALARQGQTDCGARDQALARENLVAAWQRVKANKGSAGVDGRTVQDTGEYLKSAWSAIRKGLLDGSYRREPVRRVGIPKPGGGVRAGDTDRRGPIDPASATAGAATAHRPELQRAQLRLPAGA